MNALNINKKLYLLLGLILSILIFSSAFIYYIKNEVNYRVEHILNIHLKQLDYIEKIKDIHTVNIVDTLYSTNNGEISFQDSKEVLTIALQLLKHNNKFLNKNFHAIINKDNKKLNKYLLQYINSNGDTNKNLVKNIFTSLTPLNIELTNELNKQIETINQEKIYMNKDSETHYLFLFIFVILMIFIFLVIALPIIKSLKEANDTLEDMVMNKTQELSILNNNLENKVKDRTEELKQQRNRYQFAIDGSNDGIWDWNIVTNEVYFSPKWKEIIGFSDNELLNKFEEWESRVHPDDLPKIMKLIELNLSGKQDIFVIEHRLKHKNGNWIWVLDRAKTIYDKDRKAIRISGFHTDLTKQKEQAAHLLKSEKLVSMGEMIGNIAHQWRQPLSVISTASTGMLMQKEYGVLSDEQFKITCNAINDNAQYLSKTIDDFKNFIKGDRTKKIFSLKTNINSFLKLVEGPIKSNNINIVLDIDNDIQINGYANELNQCFINIFNNAKDVLKEKEIKNKLLFITTTTKNDNASIKIKDNAGGIANSIIGRIFEPYFTTKHQTQGTGLGLNMTHNLIVDGMHGTIVANNVTYVHQGKEYTGAEFTITL